MQELIAEALKATENATAQELQEALGQIGYSAEEACDMINTAQDQGIIKISFAASALTAEDPDATNTIVEYLL